MPWTIISPNELLVSKPVDKIINWYNPCRAIGNGVQVSRIRPRNDSQSNSQTTVSTHFDDKQMLYDTLERIIVVQVIHHRKDTHSLCQSNSLVHFHFLKLFRPRSRQELSALKRRWLNNRPPNSIVTHWIIEQVCFWLCPLEQRPLCCQLKCVGINVEHCPLRTRPWHDNRKHRSIYVEWECETRRESVHDNLLLPQQVEQETMKAMKKTKCFVACSTTKLVREAQAPRLMDRTERMHSTNTEQFIIKHRDHAYRLQKNTNNRWRQCVSHWGWGIVVAMM